MDVALPRPGEPAVENLACEGRELSSVELVGSLSDGFGDGATVWHFCGFRVRLNPESLRPRIVS